MKQFIVIILFSGIILPASGQLDSAKSANALNSNYVLAPSAFSLNKKNVCYQSYDFLLHDVQIGVTNNISVGIGLAFPAYVYLTPKYTFKINEKWRMAIGDMNITGIFKFNNSPHNRINLGYAAITRGTARQHFTLGAGWLSHNIGEETPKNLPVIQASACLKISKRTSLLYEFWGATGVFKKNYSQSTWARDANGNIMTQTYYNYNSIWDIFFGGGYSWQGAATIDTEKTASRRKLLYMSSLQFRIYGDRKKTRTWSFGFTVFGTKAHRFEYINELEDYTTEKISILNSHWMALPSLKYAAAF